MILLKQKILLISCALLLALGLKANAGDTQLNIPTINGTEKLVYSMKRLEEGNQGKSTSFMMTKGEFPTKVYYETSKTTYRGKDAIKIKIKSELENKNTTEEEVIYENQNGKLRLLINNRTVKGPRGLIRKQFNDFSSPSLNYPKETIYSVSLPIVIRGVTLKKGYKTDLVLWVMEATIFKFKIEVLGEESVTVKAGTYKCHKVRMTVDLSTVLANKMLAKVVQPFIPGFDFMLNVDPPHELIRFEGLMTGIGTPPVRMEKESGA